ncbi:MAG: GNAT family N-acetyltransferase [Candidatus Bathyarchaeota archaeon]
MSSQGSAIREGVLQEVSGREMIFGDLPNIEFRRARRSEAAAIKAFLTAAYSVYVPRIGRMPAVSANFAAAIRDHFIWVLLEDDRLLAVLHLVSRSDHLLIKDVAVHVDRQRQGMGKKLLAFAEREALDRGYREIQLFTNEMMVENIALYQSLGYREFWRKPYRGTDVVYMRKPLEIPS